MKAVKMLILSDIHFGHRHTSTHFIMNNIYNMFRQYRKDIHDIDTIVITGDVTDRALMFSQDDIDYILEFFHWLSKYCIKHNITLLLLKGTDSHELTHLRTIYNNIKEAYTELDVRYFDTVTIIEYKHLLLGFVPDNVVDDNDKLLDILNTKLKNIKRDKFDILFMHTAFKYQLPYIPKDNSALKHLKDEDAFSNLVKHYCIAGHIHKHSNFKKILVPGSIDRLAHNEEEHKGMLLVTIHPMLGANYKFLINTNAMIYKTFEIHDDVATDEDKLKKFILKKIKGIPADSYIRIKITNDKLVKYLKETLLSKYNVKIEIDRNKPTKEEREKKIKSMFIINSNNIDELVKSRIILDKDELSIYMEEVYKLF